jgi:hypothetical protein
MGLGNKNHLRTVTASGLGAEWGELAGKVTEPGAQWTFDIAETTMTRTGAEIFQNVCLDSSA